MGAGDGRIVDRPPEVTPSGAPHVPLGPPPPPPGYPPYPSYPAHSARPRRRGMGRGMKLFLLLVLLMLVATIGLIGGLAAGLVRTGDLLALVGMGPGEIYVQNLSDGPIVLTLERRGDEDAVVRSHDDTIGAGDVRVYPDRPTGPWDLTFATSDGLGLGTCRLQVAGNQQYTFAVLPGLVVVSRAGAEPASGDELVIESSSLCRRTGS